MCFATVIHPNFLWAERKESAQCALGRRQLRIGELT